jgi:short-subunit dehydrogenase
LVRIEREREIVSETDSFEPAVEVRPGPEDARSDNAKRRVALITGASGGIGADLADIFARHGHDLALIARSRARLESLADEIAASGNPRPLVLAFDLSEEGAVNQIAAALEAADASPEILVNNAGFGLVGEALELDQGEQLAIVDLNVRVAMEMTLRFLPAICAARGKILNVASIASYFPGGPRMAAYYASKAFLLSFSLALHQELRTQGVTVTALCPGYTKTGFQARAGFGADMGLSRFPGSSPMEVAEAGYAGLMAGRREIVPGFINKLAVMLLPFLPKSIVLMLVSWLQQNRARLR